MSVSVFCEPVILPICQSADDVTHGANSIPSPKPPTNMRCLSECPVIAQEFQRAG